MKKHIQTTIVHSEALFSGLKKPIVKLEDNRDESLDKLIKRHL